MLKEYQKCISLLNDSSNHKTDIFTVKCLSIGTPKNTKFSIVLKENQLCLGVPKVRHIQPNYIFFLN